MTASSGCSMKYLICPNIPHLGGILGQKLNYFTQFRKIVHILFCGVQKLLYLCTKFCKLCNEFNTKF